jgi:hypothetical protein
MWPFPKTEIDHAATILLEFPLNDEYVPGPSIIDWLDEHVGAHNYRTEYQYDYWGTDDEDLYAIKYHFKQSKDATLFALRWA